MRLLRYREGAYTSDSERAVEIRLRLTYWNALFLKFLLFGCLFSVMIFFIVLDAILLQRWICWCSPSTLRHESHWWNNFTLFELILSGCWIPVRSLICSSMVATDISRLILHSWKLPNFSIDFLRARLFLLMTEPCFVFISRAITHADILELRWFRFAFIYLLWVKWAKSSANSL